MSQTPEQLIELGQGYVLSNHGYVLRNGQRIKPYSPIGKLEVKVPNKDGVLQRVSLARLVATHFIPNPEGYRFVKVREYASCHVDNLYWTGDSYG